MTIVTHDEQPPHRPAGPTPEEISARLEALLKRTHALRQAQSAADANMTADGGPAWPPTDADLAAVEVVDVPDVPAATSREAAQPAPSGQTQPPVLATHLDTVSADERASEASADFGRPDWSTLRLRETSVEPPGTPAWVWLVIAGLVIALGGETAYLLRTRPWARDTGAAVAAAPVRLRVEGAPGMRVRINDEAGQLMPVEQSLTGGFVRLAIEGPGVPPTGATAAVPGAMIGGGPAPGTATEAVNEPSTGAVLIETTPPGAVVTMGGRERGVTPITVGQLRPGRHDVLVVDAGGRRAFRVDVSAGQTSRLDASRPAQP